MRIAKCCKGRRFRGIAKKDYQIISPTEAHKLLEQYYNSGTCERGLFVVMEDSDVVAIDNSTGDAWTEEFTNKRAAIRWLRGHRVKDICGEIK